MSERAQPELPTPRRLQDCSVLITGGTSGVGLESAMQFAVAGVPRIALLGRDLARGDAAIGAVSALNPAAQVEFLSCDATTLEGAQRAASWAGDRLGRIDVLVNSTSIGYTPELLHRTPDTDIAPLLAQQTLPPIYMTRCVLPIMRKQRSGVILNIASDAAKVPTPGETIIGAAMAAIVMFSRTLALEAKRDGIRVNVLTPSLIAGTATAERVQKEGFSAKLFAKAASLAHLGVAEPGDLAALIVFLASPGARRITGQSISVNGGISAG
ncbi:MAG: oxidoreductase [Gammaproteobacteria bacterium]|jgi:2-hydroxycyclohexanecarboxyl-CoA dehydrogenase|nr:oxidoreductase [Gammaproteobacteria bacterium]